MTETCVNDVVHHRKITLRTTACDETITSSERASETNEAERGGSEGEGGGGEVGGEGEGEGERRERDEKGRKKKALRTSCTFLNRSEADRFRWHMTFVMHTVCA